VKVQILCTLGPSSLQPEVIEGLDARGVDLFRINLSHTPLEVVAPTIEHIQRHSATPICLDTEGAQVRCGPMAPGVTLEPGRMVRLTAAGPVGTAEELGLQPPAGLDAVRPGTELGIDFNGARLRVTEITPAGVTALVVEGGQVRSNKAVTVEPAPLLPALSEKDYQAIAIGARMGVRHVALSFARRAEDVALLREVAGSGTMVISKLESRAGIRNMDAVISASDAVLIDRGDLSREIPLEQVPFYQKVVVRRANRWNRPVYVATNLLESMVTSRHPTVAEANDIANTLLDGVHGLVLAAETAIGVDPVGTVEMVQRVVTAFERWNTSALLDEDRQALAVLAGATGTAPAVTSSN
jgi:sulfate adenylyltransferase